MFRHPKDVYINTTIHETRAPTDESVKLLREMEKEAEKKIVSAVRVDDNALSAVIHAQENYISGTREYKCIFSLNGQRMTADYVVSAFDVDKEKILVGLRDAVAEQIANKILQTTTIKQ